MRAKLACVSKLPNEKKSKFIKFHYSLKVILPAMFLLSDPYLAEKALKAYKGEVCHIEETVEINNTKHYYYCRIF